MKLKKLIKDIPHQEVKGSKDLEITGICANSKLVSPGNLFIAKKGRTHYGSEYIPEAIGAGAVAIVTDIYDPTLRDVTQIIHHDPIQIEALLAAQYYQYPGNELFMIGITGTNGKTTTAFLVKHLFDHLRGSCGLIGTIEYIIGSHRYQATRTTPDVATNHKMLRDMCTEGCGSAVMEVTSHGLDQGRVDFIDFDIAIFTNLTLDHLDYHKTMENYCLAKNRLFRHLDPAISKKDMHHAKQGIINADDPWHLKIAEGCKSKIITYAIDNEATLRAQDIRLTALGTELNLRYEGKLYACFFPLIGRFNVYNCLAAIGAGLASGAPLETIIELIKSFKLVPGRLEPVDNPLGLKIYIDFAHSDDALKNVLGCLQELEKKRIITVFGCGGERDLQKRPKMGRVCEELSDICIVTSDNPRSENPQSIIDAIVAGFQNTSKVMVEIDRRKAIEKAIDLATPDDIILIAGRGHETHQIFARHSVEFDDRKVTAQICQEKALFQTLV